MDRDWYLSMEPQGHSYEAIEMTSLVPWNLGMRHNEQVVTGIISIKTCNPNMCSCSV